MDMKKIIENAHKAHIMELLLMPALLYTYDLGSFAYWVVLILFDQYILRHENILEMLMVFQEESYKQEIKKNSDIRNLYVGLSSNYFFKKLASGCHLCD